MEANIDLQSDTVERALSKNTLTVEPQVTVREVFSLLQAHSRGSVFVCEENRPVGIFTERDVLKLMASGADLDVRLEDVMIRNPVTIRRDQSLSEALRVMSEGGYRRLPVVDKDGLLVGGVKVTGIVDYLVDHFPNTVFNLPPQPEPMMAQREGA